MTIKELQDEIIEEFDLYTDWMDKYESIIQMGKDLPLIDAQYKTADCLIKGCQSNVWLHADYQAGKIWFSADSEALITKGLISMIIRVLSGHTPQEIAAADLYFVPAIGLTKHLSPTRANGLLAMLRQMKAYAVAFQAKEATER